MGGSIDIKTKAPNAARNCTATICSGHQIEPFMPANRMARPRDWRIRHEINGLHTTEAARIQRSEEHTSELQSLMRLSYAVFCLKKKTTTSIQTVQSVIM